jgi:hypothetical protein
VQGLTLQDADELATRLDAGTAKAKVEAVD